MDIWKFRWKQFAIAAMPITIVIFFPVWYRWLNPSFYADIRCAIERENGEIILATGNDCY